MAGVALWGGGLIGAGIIIGRRIEGQTSRRPQRVPWDTVAARKGV